MFLNEKLPFIPGILHLCAIKFKLMIILYIVIPIWSRKPASLACGGTYIKIERDIII